MWQKHTLDKKNFKLPENHSMLLNWFSVNYEVCLFSFSTCCRLISACMKRKNLKLHQNYCYMPNCSEVYSIPVAKNCRKPISLISTNFIWNIYVCILMQEISFSWLIILNTKTSLCVSRSQLTMLVFNVEIPNFMSC